MNTQSKPTGLRNFLILAVIALLLFGGIGITGVAAQSSIPGDALYSVKTSIEQTRLSLAKDAGDRAQLKLSFAEMRLSEISMLIEEGRYREIKNAVLSFEASINSTIIELETVAKGDPARAAELAKEITSALTRYAQTLSVLAASAPDSIKDDVTRALDSAQLAGSLDMPSDDDNSNDNGNDNSNDNGNDNGDDNSNDNGDDNSNDNGDDNSNDNGDDNSNDNGDDNSNDNGDDNSNDSGDDNSNDSGDDNSNDSGDDNSNDNGDDNSNDNGDDNSNDNGDDNSNDSGDDNSNDSGDDNSNDDNSNDDNSGKGNGGG